MARTTNIENTIKRGEPGYDLACDAITLDSLIDGEDPATDDFAAMLAPIRDNIRKALRALLAAHLVLNDPDASPTTRGRGRTPASDARDLVAAALTEEVE